ncbi:hypothetical protein RUM43_004283, partial [Polyplax serrata]
MGTDKKAKAKQEESDVKAKKKYSVAACCLLLWVDRARAVEGLGQNPTNFLQELMLLSLPHENSFSVPVTHSDGLKTF